MHITVEDKTVGENIHSFLELLRKAEALREKKGAALIEKSYKAFLNRTSGKLVFADAFKDQKAFSSHDWKELSIEYLYDPFTESFHAIAYEANKESEAFKFTGLSPLAIKTIQSTMTTLNKLSSLVKGSGSDLITKVKAICKLQMDIGSVQKNKSIVVAAWHSVDRVKAEKLLNKQPPGTFLFREDYYAKILSQQLSDRFGKDVKCITLTILEHGGKVSDFTLAHLDHLWRWYDDALFCNVRGYTSIEELLDICFKDRAVHPLYHSFPEENIAV